MARDSALNVSVGIIAAVMICVAASQASAVFAPLALALFIIALVWPLQSWLQARMPALLALAITMTVTVAVCIAFASLAVWGFGRVGVSLIADSARYQAIYEKAIDWLDDRGISVAGLWSEHFNVSWLLHWAGQITGRVNTTLSFWLIALLYVILGLMEVDVVRRRAKAFLRPETSLILLQGSRGYGGEDPQVYGSAHDDERGDRRSRRRVRLDRRVAVRARMGRDHVRAQLHSIHRPLRRHAVSDLGGDDLVRLVGSGRRGFRLPQHHPVRGRQLYRATGVRRGARDVADGRVARRLLVDLPLGPVRRFHRRADRHRDRHLLRLSSLQPLARRSLGRAPVDNPLAQSLGRIVSSSGTEGQFASAPSAPDLRRALAQSRGHRNGLASSRAPSPVTGRRRP